MKKFIPKVYFIDLDGTALDIKNENKEHILSQKNATAIRETLKHTPVIISTGRSWETSERFFKLFPKMQYLITFNGAMIYDKKGKLLVRHNINLSASHSILNWAKNNKLSIKPSTSESFHGTKGISKFMANMWNFSSSPHYYFEMRPDIVKFVVMGKSPRGLRKVQAKLTAMKLPLSIVTSARGWTLEITSNKATKGLGNALVAEKLGVLPETTVHIGDTMNDSTVVGFMHHLVAMKNSSKRLKRMARVIGPNYKNGGLAKYLNKKNYEKSKLSIKAKSKNKPNSNNAKKNGKDKKKITSTKLNSNTKKSQKNTTNTKKSRSKKIIKKV